MYWSGKVSRCWTVVLMSSFVPLSCHSLPYVCSAAHPARGKRWVMFIRQPPSSATTERHDKPVMLYRCSLTLRRVPFQVLTCSVNKTLRIFCISLHRAAWLVAYNIYYPYRIDQLVFLKCNGHVLTFLHYHYAACELQFYIILVISFCTVLVLVRPVFHNTLQLVGL